MAVVGDHVTITGGPDPDHRRVDTATSYDAFDNPTFVFVSSIEGTFRWAALTYDNDPVAWRLGEPTRLETAAGDWAHPAPEPRVTTYDYDDRGLLHTVTVEPDHAELRRVTRYLRNEDGLPEEVLVSTAAGSRPAFFAYDKAERMFPVATWNAHADYTRHAYHPGYGVAVLEEDPNGVQTATSYDRFARVRRGAPAGGTAASISYASADCRTNAAAEKGMCVAVVYDDGAEHVAYTDEYGRTWEVGDRGFDGTMVFREQRYNVFGQPVRLTRPFTGYAGPATITTFDTLSRPVLIDRPDTATTTFSYTLATTTVVDPNSHTAEVHLRPRRARDPERGGGRADDVRARRVRPDPDDPGPARQCDLDAVRQARPPDAAGGS